MTPASRLALRGFVVVLHFTCASAAWAQLLSPGELARPHENLEGDAHCVDCHAQGRRVDTARCTHCHTDIGTQLRAQRGLHGKQYRGQDCGHCHVEHRGLDHDLVRWPGGSQKAFDHASTGYALQGAHAKQGCDACHGRKKSSRGARTFLGLSRACGSCHEDPHAKRLGQECQQCHNDRAWKSVKLDGFDHELARFALRGKHTKVECKGCHGAPAKYRDLDFGTCTDCHEDPHRGELGATCTNCHSETGWAQVSMKRSAHPGLSLGGGHRGVQCGQCHDQGSSVAPSRGSRCVSCHAPVHEAKFGNDCAHCHKRIRWLGLPEALGRSVHDKTPFTLLGMHREVACGGCHSTERPPAQRYRALRFERCKDCHHDTHNGEFAARDDGECVLCHDEHGFAPTLFGVELHATTGFALDGRHVAVPCSGCHGDAHPRVDLRVTKQACADCHANPHGDQFTAEMRDGGCAHCHSALGWHAPNIDHSTWPLTGSHALAACSACHNPNEADRLAGRGASYRGVPRDCEGCHADVHLGQFRLSEPLRDCTHCHGTTSFKLPRFDHVQLAGYPLEGEHAALECAQCHAPATLRNGAQAVRYRLGYRRCADCHKNPHVEGGP